MKKPRVRFCWSCGRQLWGNHFDEKLIQGEIRILHKGCSKKLVADETREEPYRIQWAEDTSTTNCTNWSNQ